MKVSEVILFQDTRNQIEENEFIVQFTVTIIGIAVFISFFADSEIGKDWSEIVNQFFTQRVFITKFNGQTGKLELFNCNSACQKDIFKEQGFDCQIFKPPSDIVDKNNMIDLKQYLVHRHLYILDQINSKSSITKASESSFTQFKGNQKMRQRTSSQGSLIKNKRRRSSNFYKFEQMQISYKDEKSNTTKIFKMKIDQFGVSNSPQLIVMLDDESHAQEIIRHKQDKSVLETFLFSLMKNVQEKLKYSIWGLENGFIDSVKVESYMLINQVYCILDYFIIKAKKLKGNFKLSLNNKIQKILNVETFSWQTLMNELLDLFGDLQIVSEKDLEQIYLTQDRRKVKQVLIALLSWSQYRAVGDYELKVTQIKKKQWNALLFTLQFETEQKPNEFKKEFYKYLNGNQIDLLNQVEEEVIKETVMLLGPYQIKEEVSDTGIVQISFAFFQDLVVIYDSVKVDCNTLVTQNEANMEQDNQISQKKFEKNQDPKTISFEEHVTRMKERKIKISARKINTLESSNKEVKQNTVENFQTNSNEEEQQMEFFSDFKSTGKMNQQENIYSINNEQFQISRINSIEQIQDLPIPLSPKNMNKIGHCEKNTVIQNNQNQAQTLISFTPGQTNNQFSNKNTLNNMGSFEKNKQYIQSSIPNLHHTPSNKIIFFQKTQNDEDAEISNKMQSSIYTKNLTTPITQKYDGNRIPTGIDEINNLNLLKQTSTPMSVEKMNLTLCKQLTENKIGFTPPKRMKYHTPKNQVQVQLPQFTYFSQRTIKQHSKFKRNDSLFLNQPEIIKEQSNEQYFGQSITNPTQLFQTQLKAVNLQNSQAYGSDKFNTSIKANSELNSPILPNLGVKNSKMIENSHIMNQHRNSIILFSNQQATNSREDVSILIKKPLDNIQTSSLIKRGFAEDVISIQLNQNGA